MLTREQDEIIKNNIINLLENGHDDLSIRFNHVITEPKYQSISKYINIILESFNSNNKIKGIAFIQATKHNSIVDNTINLFKLADEWADVKEINIKDDKIGRRKIAENIIGDLKIEFIKNQLRSRFYISMFKVH